DTAATAPFPAPPASVFPPTAADLARAQQAQSGLRARQEALASANTVATATADLARAAADRRRLEATRDQRATDLAALHKHQRDAARRAQLATEAAEARRIASEYAALMESNTALDRENQRLLDAIDAATAAIVTAKSTAVVATAGADAANTVAGTAAAATPADTAVASDTPVASAALSPAIPPFASTSVSPSGLPGLPLHLPGLLLHLPDHPGLLLHLLDFLRLLLRLLLHLP
ncbi:unnamed protein product, partial [Pylaiella littoralis]